MKMDYSTLVKHIFNYDYEICQNNWSADMKYIFPMLDMNDVFNNALMCNMKSVREQMTIFINRQWSIDVNNKTKLRTMYFSKVICSWKIMLNITCTDGTDLYLRNFG